MQKQNWNAEQYQKDAFFVPQLGNPVLELLAPRIGEKILDLGCGDGELTLKIQSYNCDVLGIDSSASMVEIAEQKGLNVKVLPAEKLSDREEFDAIFSNAVLHWIPNINEVVNRIYTALKPGSRFKAIKKATNNDRLEKLSKSHIQEFGCFPRKQENFPEWRINPNQELKIKCQ